MFRELNVVMTISSANSSTGMRFGGISTSVFAKYTMVFFMAALAVVPGKPYVFLAVTALAILLMVSGGRIERRLLPLLLPIMLLILVGIINAGDNPLFEVTKDIYYVGKTIVALSLGYILARYLKDFRSLCRILIIAAAVSALSHIVEVIVNYGEETSIFDLRADEIRGSFISVVGLAALVILWNKKAYVSTSRALYYFAFAICSLSLILSFSRTFVLLFIVMLVVLKGWAAIKPKNIIRIAISVAVLVIAIFALSSTIGNGQQKSFAGKVLHSLSEITFENYTNKRDINLNWRGFESYRALVDYAGGGAVQKLVGQGLGSTVDLGFYMKLGESYFRYIPILHNGYMYVLVKFGLVGMAIILFWLFSTIRYGSARNTVGVCSGELFARRLLAALGWSFLLSTFVVSGIFNGSMFPALILWGALVAWVGQKRSFG